MREYAHVIFSHALSVKRRNNFPKTGDSSRDSCSVGGHSYGMQKNQEDQVDEKVREGVLISAGKNRKFEAV